jgi:septal ring factor EnvC (AmiA/AmiB activator)
MKKYFICVFIVSVVLQAAYSQTVNVVEVSADFSNGRSNAIETKILKSDSKTVEKAWSKLMKDYDAKVSSKKEIFADDALIKSISDNTIDVYAIVKQERKSEDVQLIVSFDLGGAYLSSSQHPAQYNAAVKIIQDFAIQLITEAYNEMISNEEKELDNIVKDRDRVKKDKEYLEKQNEDYLDKIEKNKNEIEEKEKELKEKNSEIEEKSKEIEQIKDEAKKIK